MREDTLALKIQGIVEKFVCESDRFEIDPKELGLRLKLKGDNWQGVVDRNIAKFLLDLDRQVSQELCRQGINIDSGHDGIIVLKIREGSTEAYFEYAKGIMESFRKMNTKDQVVLGVIILTSIGLFKASDIIDAINKPTIADIASKEKIEIIATTANAVNENTRELQKPMRSLIRAMKEKDTIILPNSAKPVTAEVASEELVKGSRSTKKNFYIDHPYTVLALSTKNPNKWTITLGYGEISFVALIMLSQEEMSKLLADFQQAHARGSKISPALQVNAEITSKGVKSATVVSMGNPRPLSKSLGTALSEAATVPQKTR